MRMATDFREEKWGEGPLQNKELKIVQFFWSTQEKELQKD